MRRAQKCSRLSFSRNPPPTAFFPTRAWTDLSAKIHEQWVPRKPNGRHSGTPPSRETQQGIVPHRQTRAQLNTAIGSGSSAYFTQSLFRYPSHQGVMMLDPRVDSCCPKRTVASFAGGMPGWVPRWAKMYVKKASAHRLRGAIATRVLRPVRDGTEPNPFGGACSPQ
jgi:hypothetical protein